MSSENNADQLRNIACPVCGRFVEMDDDECPACHTRFDLEVDDLIRENIKSGPLMRVLQAFDEWLPSFGKSERSKEKTEKLISFDDVGSKFKLKNQHYLGTQAICIADIIGSLGRYNDFNRQFLPVKGFSTQKLTPILNKMKAGTEMPPITVYEIGSKYFVIDGHHRVSASLMLDREFIDAEITRVVLDVNLESNPFEAGSDEMRSFIVELERRSFQKRTYLYNNILSYPVLVTNTASYGKLFEDLMQTHRSNTEKIPGYSLIASAFEWYRHKFLPIIRLIHGYGLADKFPERTACDLYVWLLMHRYFLSQETGYDIGFKTTLADFIKRNGKKAYYDDIPTRYDAYLKYLTQSAEGKK